MAYALSKHRAIKQAFFPSGREGSLSLHYDMVITARALPLALLRSPKGKIDEQKVPPERAIKPRVERGWGHSPQITANQLVAKYGPKR